jgi:hypothetical protein
MIMSTLAIGAAVVPAPAEEARRKPSLFQRFLTAREAEANRRLHAFLLAQSGASLMDLGFAAEDIAALRQGKSRRPRR